MKSPICTRRLVLCALLISCAAASSVSASEDLQYNIGENFFYLHEADLYDGASRIQSVSRTGQKSDVSRGTLPEFGAYDFESTGTGTDTFTIRGKNVVELKADRIGTGDLESGAPDGVWDKVEVVSLMSWTLKDRITVVPENDDWLGLPTVFSFKWNASNNKLVGVWNTVEEEIGCFDGLGCLARPLNGYSAIVDSYTTIEIFAPGLREKIYDYPHRGFLFDRPQDGLTQTTTVNVPDAEVSQAIPCEYGVPFDVEIRLTLDIVMTVESSRGQPDIRFESDFANTFNPLAFGVLDENGDPVPGVTYESEAGIRYDLSEAPEEPMRVPGDTTLDGVLDLSDGVRLLLFLFSDTVTELPCGDGTADHSSNVELADFNGDTNIDVSDAAALLGFLFMDGPPHALGTEPLPITGCAGI
ncbi:MAG: hypothetical protein AAF517_04970 [Planctomycetota bacterium]